MVGKQMDDIKIPEDLGIKIGSKEEAKWREIIGREEESLIALKINVEITENLLILAKKRADEEHKKFTK
ncbi:MAG: hypothetical protein GWP19_00335 [Planctomycetia bacterium]|nr:hypothetical protein [Planctomycetia bacterium]